MTIVDQIKTVARTIIQELVDKEPIGYMEAAGLSGIIMQARHNISVLSLLFNQATDPELRELIKESIYELAIPTIEECEKLMRAGDADIPDIHFPSHPLLNDLVEYPQGVRLTDMEIAIALGNLARNSQLGLFLTLQQSYQLEITAAINKLLTGGMQWDYRLLQLMIHHGWLPKIPKVEH